MKGQEMSAGLRLRQAFDEMAAGRVDEARRRFAQLVGEAAVSTDAYRGLAAANWRLGEAAAAIEFLRTATTQAPRHVEAHADLALVLMTSGQSQAAVPVWERVIELRPDDADIWHNYAKLLGDLKRYDHAQQAFQRSLSLQPGRVPTLTAYARMLAAAEQYPAAEQIWLELLERFPQQAEVHLGLGQTHFAKGDLAAAMAAFRSGIEAAPDSADLHMAYAQMQEDFADREGAEASFRRALALRPDWPVALEGLLTLSREKTEPALIARAQALVEDPRRPDADRANVGFGLGKVYDARGEYEQAMRVWRQANAARRRQFGGFDRARASERVDRIITAFSAERMGSLAGQGHPDAQPVFVLGMPRSGTSLVEQIIAVHPDAYGYGELKEISTLARQMPTRCGSIQRWPEAIEAVDGRVLREAASAYLEVLNHRHPQAPDKRSVDKAPLNFFHVGLIALLFPQARILWCLRDPRDVCVSIYGENFALEQAFATDLADLGFYYREHLRLMRHWQAVLGKRIAVCRYEAMIEDPEQGARGVIAAAGLPWDDVCLRFHEQDRPVLTPSRWQVRQPIYTSASGRWKRYENWLAPLLDALGDEVPA